MKMDFEEFRVFRALKFALDSGLDVYLLKSGQIRFPEFFSLNPNLKGIIGCEKEGRYFVNLSALNELYEGGADEEFVIQVITDTLVHESTHMAVSNLFRECIYLKLFQSTVEKMDVSDPNFRKTQTKFFYYLFRAFLRRKNNRTRANINRARIKT